MQEQQQPWLAHYDEGVPHTIAPAQGPIYALLDAAAQNFPKAPACVFQNTKLNYAQLQEKAEIFAASLRRLGVKHGDRVALMLPNLPQTVIAFWGIMKAGGVAVMINPLYMEKEIVHHIQDSQTKFIIMLDLLWPKIQPLRKQLPLEQYIVTSIKDALTFPLNWLYAFKEKRNTHTVSLPQENCIHAWKEMFESCQRYSAQDSITEHDLALLQYTGGTTGLPKGVMLTHGNIGSNCAQISSIIQNFSHKRQSFVGILPFFHVYGLSVSLLIPTALAANILPLPRYVPQDVLKLIKKHKPTVFPGAPAVYTSLMQQKNLASFDLSCIKLCISGSAPLPTEHFHKFQKLTGATIVEGYGLTEAAPITHINPLSAKNQKAGSIGIPLPGTDARIVDTESGSLPLPIGKLGELIVRGPQIMSGYWNKPDESASALRNGWLYTGDLAVMDEDGYFHIMDRKKDMIIVAGYNVYPREIDEVLLENPKILEAVSVGIEDATRGEVIKVYIVLKPDTTMTRAEVTTWCRDRLASYKVPKAVEFREELPKTVVGKVLRRVLREEEQKLAAAQAIKDETA